MKTSQQREIIQALYALKRQFPTPLDLYNEAQIGYNAKTGKNTVLRQKWYVPRAILLPSNLIHSFKFLVKAFQVGGAFTLEDRTLLLDSKDLPKGFDVITTVKYVVVNHKRFEPQKVTMFDGGVGWFLVVREMSNATPQEIFDATLKDTLTLGEAYGHQP